MPFEQGSHQSLIDQVHQVSICCLLRVSIVVCPVVPLVQRLRKLFVQKAANCRNHFLAIRHFT